LTPVLRRTRRGSSIRNDTTACANTTTETEPAQNDASVAGAGRRSSAQQSQ
jgi:hypothetical protein